MTLTSVSAAASLKARMAATQTGTAGAVQLGQDVTQAFTDANICYSSKVRGLNATNTASLNLGSGAWTVSGYTVIDGDGKDWEGTTVPTLSEVYAILLVTDAANTAAVIASISTGYGFTSTAAAQCTCVWIFPSGMTPADTLDFESTGAPAVNNCTVHILGKTA